MNNNEIETATKSLQETFAPLKELSLDYDSADILREYRQIAAKVDIDDFLGYSNKRNPRPNEISERSIFHIILSVQVSERSDFVPFYSILNWNSRFDANQRKEVLKLGEDRIRYNYSDFLSGFMRNFNAQFGCEKNMEVPKCAFTVEASSKTISDLRFLPCITNQALWFYNQEDDITESKLEAKASGLGQSALSVLKEELFPEEESTFVQVLSDYYKDAGPLRFSFYNLDSDFKDSASCLTRLMIISSSNEKDEATQFLKYNLNKIREIVSFIRARYVYDLVQKSRHEAEKSAKSAIMSRNMSHNLGSHVMSYLKQHLSSVTDIIDDGALFELFEGQQEFESFFKFAKVAYEKRFKDKDKTEDVALPFFVGLGRFISYLQERQDFIATIATSYIPYYSTVNFKDAIYDELNPDKRYERHPKLMGSQKLDNILLGNIARSEGLGRASIKAKNDDIKGDIVLKFRAFNGDPVEEPLAGQKGSDAYESLREMRQYDFSLPGGLVGRQAVFSIVENIIRNAAKHGNWRQQQNLEVTFDIFNPNFEKDSSRLKAINNDNWSDEDLSLAEVYERFYEGASDIDENYLFTVTDNAVLDRQALSKLRKGLNEDYVEESGQMKSANKGLKEIRISSSWIRAIKQEKDDCIQPICVGKEDQPDRKFFLRDTEIGKKAPIVYVRGAMGNDGFPHLQYIFCVPIPKKVALVNPCVFTPST